MFLIASKGEGRFSPHAWKTQRIEVKQLTKIEVQQGSDLNPRKSRGIKDLIEARVGIGRLKHRLRDKITRFHWLHKLTLLLPKPALSVHRC